VEEVFFEGRRRNSAVLVLNNAAPHQAPGDVRGRRKK
jgi:hypothetical protein